MSIRKIMLPDGVTRWEVFIPSGPTGSKQYRRRFELKVDAQEFESAVLEERRQRGRLDDGLENFEETTLAKEADYWLATKGLSVSPGYKKRVDGVLKRLLPKYGSLSTKKFHVGMLTRIQTEMLKDREISEASSNKEINVLTGILKHSAENRRIPINPTAGFRRLKEAKKEITFWEEDEARRFLAFANAKYPTGSDERWIYLAYLTALNTGLRAGEIWGLQAPAILHGRALLHIYQQYDRVDESLRPLKDKEERMVPCNESLYKELAAWTQRPQFKSSKRFLFLNQEGNPIDHDNFRKRVFDKDVKACAEVSRITFHDLRHTAATLMISKGVDVPTVQLILGHEDVSTTMRYVHCLKENIRNTALIFSITPLQDNDFNSPNSSNLRLVR